MTVALCAIPLTLAIFGVMDLLQASGEHAALQSAVDAGALAETIRVEETR